jgi:hypothetical protein
MLATEHSRRISMLRGCRFDPTVLGFPIPTVGRMMAFVDGENLTLRYEDMLKKGHRPSPQVQHKLGTYVWTTNVVIQPGWNQILRASYYTYCTGDDNAIAQVARNISELTSGQISGILVALAHTPR